MPNDAARRFAANTVAAAERAFLDAFRDGVEEACDEDDELEPCDWEELLRNVAAERSKLYAFYLPAINRMSGDLTTIQGLTLGALLQLSREGLTQEQVDSIARLVASGANQAAVAAAISVYPSISNPYEIARQLVELQRRQSAVRDSIKRRLKLLFDGLSWAAAELGRASVLEGRGRSIYWYTDPNAENCGGCVALEAGSPYPSLAAIGTLPGAGGTQCKSNCRCHLEVA